MPDAAKSRYYDILKPFITSGPNAKGEYRARCPLHKDGTPSAYFNFDKGVYHCKSGCEGGSLRALVRSVRQGLTNEDDDEDNPFSQGRVVSFQAAKDKKEGAATGGAQLPNEDKIQEWHKALLENPNVLTWLQKERGLSDDIILRYELGFDRSANRYTIPVRNAAGDLVNVRRYKRDADKMQKMWNVAGFGSPPRLYPIDQMQHDDVLIVEGEWDALCCISNGVPAVTGTAGASTWRREWAADFKGKRVAICYDHDREGHRGEKVVRRSLLSSAASVVILQPLAKVAKSDVSDWFSAGGTGPQLAEIILATKPEAAKEEPVAEATDIKILDTMDAQRNGQLLRLKMMVSGRRDPTYSVPRKVHCECTLDYMPKKCAQCPMFDVEGEYDLILPNTGVDVAKRTAQYIDVSSDKVDTLLRKELDVPPRCPRLTLAIVESTSVEEVYGAAPLDARAREDTDYTNRRFYIFNEFRTQPNTTVEVEGTTWPNKDGRHNDFFGWSLKEVGTSIDSFKMAPDVRKRLRKFQPIGKQRPIDKARDIAQDLSSNVTRIYGRDRMHMLIDLVYHSILQFPLDGKILNRGWLEALIVGDTRTGKSESVIRLSEFYGLGTVIGCEGATFAGLVGGVKTVGGNNEWTTQWGEIPLNDRRLIALDEVSGLAQEIIGQMSDIRSRGVAQLTKIDRQETHARCRAIWVSNPRKSRNLVDEKLTSGIGIIEGLIGNPEDIARFDVAMSVRSEDVSTEEINDPDNQYLSDPFYDAESCRDLILWAWSRAPEQVVWDEDSGANALVYAAAEWLGKRYSPHPPLIQGTNVREKVARLAVALAARVFSTDKSGELVVVKEEHVRDAVNFLDKLYNYENFGYGRVSRLHYHKIKLAKENRNRIKKMLQEHPALLSFLITRQGISFRGQDLEEMAFMQRDEANLMIYRLSEAGMVTKDRAQIVMEPEFQDLLKEFPI